MSCRSGHTDASSNLADRRSNTIILIILVYELQYFVESPLAFCPHTSTSVSIWDFKSRYRYYTQLGENYKRVTESQKGGAANRLHLLQRRVYLGCEVDYTAYFLFKSQK